MTTLLLSLLLSASALAADPQHGYAGLWATPLGRMRLIEGEGGKVEGIYDYSGGGELKGYVRGEKLVMRYKDVDKGDAEFTLAPDGHGFTGRWRADGDKEWEPWDGVRVEPEPKRRWLYVLESRWEENLADREYTYGQLLKVFFDYSNKAEVRQRAFSNRAGLVRWLKQAAFLAEPVVVYVSGHGTTEGVESDSGPVGGDDIGKALRWAPTVELLHFGSCEVMKGKMAERIRKHLPKDRAPFPISGFTEAVDWAGSAVADLMYLNLILDDGMEPAKAAEEMQRLLPYTVHADTTSAVGPIGFTLK